MRLLHGSDFHVGLASYGRPIEEIGASFERFVDLAIAEKVDLAIAAGDTFHSRRPGPKELRIVAEATRRLVDAAIPFVIATGNHDGMVTIADPQSQTLGWLDALDLPGVHVGVEPRAFTIPDAGVVCILPYAHKRAISDPGLSLRERTDESSRILEEAITALVREGEAVRADYGAEGHPVIFVGHLTSEHASLGAEAAMQMGWDTTVDPVVFEPYDYAALGHIHIGQQVNAKAWYSGSPDVHAFGEQADDKRLLLVEVERGKDPVVTIKPTSPRPFQQVAAWENDDWIAARGRAIADGAIVQLELHPTGKMDPRVARELVESVRMRGAAFVQTVVIEPEQSRQRRRSMEAEAPISDQVDAWLATQPAPEDTKGRAREIARRALSVHE